MNEILHESLDASITAYMKDEPNLILPRNVNYMDIEDRLRFHADVSDLYKVLENRINDVLTLDFAVHADTTLRRYEISSSDLYDNLLMYREQSDNEMDK